MLLVIGIMAGLLLVLITGLLIAPLQLLIDTTRQQYLFRWWGLGHVAILPASDDFYLQVRLLFFRKKWSFIELLKKNRQKATPPTPTSSKRKSGPKKAYQFFRKNWKRKVRRLWNAFRVKYLYINLDTDDYLLNSYLYPLHLFSRGPHRQVRINYTGQVIFQLRAEVRLYRILFALIF